MPTHGLKPRKFLDHRRYDYFRTFKDDVKKKLGGVGVPYFILTQYCNPNQNEPDNYWPRPSLPNGCTGFATANIAESDVKAPLNPAFTYDKTLLIQNGQDGDLCTLEDSFKSATVYGVALKGETEQEALFHRRAPYFEVRPNSQYDYFDSVMRAVYTNQRPVSVGTTWPVFFEMVPTNGIQNYTPLSWVGGHDHNIIGKTTIGGIEYLIDKSWNGPQWGDNGLSYFSREIFNAMMKIKGSDALTNRPALPGDIQLVKLNIMQVLISLINRLLASLKT